MGARRAFIDLGAERVLISAEKGDEKIAVEIKSFLGLSDLQDLDQAIGQFSRYRKALRRQEPDRNLFLAIPSNFFDRFFAEPFFAELLEELAIRAFVYDETKPGIRKWI